MNMTKIIGDEFPEYIVYQQKIIFNILEDVHSVSSMTELQEAIDNIGDEAGTVFITSGTHVVDTPIDIDGGGSLVIYGHGDNTILQPDDGVNVFNITDCASLTIKNLQIDATNYTGATSSIIVNETNDNVITIEDVTIVGNNLGTGIELVSDNCIIEHCNIDNMLDGIYLNNSNRNIIAQNTVSNNARYGIYLNTVLYSNIGNNTCNLNLTGIYALDSSNNSLSNNICNQNTENGIYLTSSSYNTVSGNTCENNDSNTINAQAGIFITTNSDFNTITGNSLNNNNNIGVGTSYGIIIALDTCNENIVASNNANGNDVDFMDAGTATTITYYVQDAVELQDAIDSIGTKAGIINLEGSFTVSATILIDGNGSYIIRGAGSNSTLTTIGDISCFNIDTARSVLLQNFMIDASSLTTATREIIDVNEDADNIIILDNVIITGDGMNGYGIELNSDNCRIENCTIDSINIGINVLSNSNIINGNNANSCASYGIQIGADYNNITSNICNSNLTGIYVLNGTGNTINDNTIQTNTQNGIYLSGSSQNSLNDNICDGNDSNTGNPQGGIVIDAISNNNMIISNTLINNNNAGAGFGYGVYIGNANCVGNIVKSNNLSGNDIKWQDIGVNSDFEYKCSTGQDIQDAIDSIAAKSGNVKILSIAGGIQLTATIDVDGGGNYIIEGEGEGCVIDCAGDRTAFNITDALYCKISNLKIDADDHTGNFTNSIDIDEASDNRVVIEYISVVNPNGAKFGRGVLITSDNCVIQNCSISRTYIGIQVGGEHNLILNNHITMTDNSGITILGDNNEIIGNDCNNNDISAIKLLSCDSNIISNNNCNNNGAAGQGIYLSASNMNVIIGNQCSGNFHYGIHIYQSNYNNIIGNNCSENDYDQVNDGGGIWLDTNSDYNIISGNVLYGNVNIGAGDAYGINIFDNTCNENCIGFNLYRTNDIDYNDIGTGTILSGDNTAYNEATWNGDLGTPTKNVIRDKFESLNDAIEALDPIGSIMMFSGAFTNNVTKVGWYKCDGNNGTIDLVDKFVRGGDASGAEGGSDDAVVVSHTHMENIAWGVGAVEGVKKFAEFYNEGLENYINTDNTGVSGVGKNIPTFYTLIFIQRIS